MNYIGNGVGHLKDEAIFKGSFQKALQLVAPGTTLRLGLENILKARTGALLVVGDSRKYSN